MVLICVSLQHFDNAESLAYAPHSAAIREVKFLQEMQHPNIIEVFLDTQENSSMPD